MCIETDSLYKLTWNAPEYDGGSPISGYYVERYIGSSWDIVNKTPTSVSSLSFITLFQRVSDNEFRVRAVNKSGQGPPSKSVKHPGLSVSIFLVTKNKPRTWDDAQRDDRPT